MRVGIYARISDDREELQLGVGRQVSDCEELAARDGDEIVDRYVDNDISAYLSRKRPEYRRMLDDLLAGRIEGVIVYHQDRLHRQPRELEEFFDACDRAGVTRLATVSGDIDLSTHDGRFHARIMGAVARKSSDDMSRRIRRKHLELAMSGHGVGGGSRPFGFEDDRVLIQPDEAAIIRDLAARLLAGETLRSLCADLNQRGIMTTSGRPWQSTPLKRMLRSGRISGQREHRGEIVADAVWPAIITPEQTASIRAILDDPQRRASRPARSYLLKGLLRCSDCGAVLIARPRSDGSRAYVCASGRGDARYSGCGKRRVLAEPIELFVSEAVISRLDTPELERAIRGRKPIVGSEWQQRADNAIARLDELAVAYGSEQISMREWLAAREPLERQRDQAMRRLAEANGTRAAGEWAGRGEMLRQRWAGLGLDRQRAIIASVLAYVLVRPGRRGYNRFDPARFELMWRL